MIPSMLEGSPNPGPANLYVQHPQSGSVGKPCVIPGTSFAPVTINESAWSVYELLRSPRTKADLVSALTEQKEPFAPANSEATVRVEPILQEMVACGLVIEVPPGAPVPSDQHAAAKRLLCEAEQRLGAGDWSGAMALCREAGKDQAFATVAELDTLIARYQGGSLDGMVEQACMLSPRLTGPSQACCDALALLAAERTGDLTTAKLVALHLSRRFESYWDLPTVPSFAFQVHDRVIVLESRSVEPMLAAIEGLLSARVAQPDENALLEALAGRYRERKLRGNE